MGLVLLHRPDIFLPGLRDALDLRGQNVFKHIFLDIALALYAEGGHAVAGHLSQKGAGHPLDAKGKACVLNRALVSDLRQHFHKGGGFFRRKPFIDFIDFRRGITQLCRRRDGLLWHRRMSQKRNLCQKNPSQNCINRVIIANLSPRFNQKGVSMP